MGASPWQLSPVNDTYYLQGNVGVGITVPLYPLDVSGVLHVKNTNGVIDVQTTTTTNNLGIGSQIFNVMTGLQNTSVGQGSMAVNSTGSYNTAVGYAAMNTNVSGIYNTAIGYGAYDGTSYSYSTSIGYNSQPTAANQVVLGTAAEHVLIPGTGGSISTTTGALQVAGGAGILGNVYVRGNIVAGNVQAQKFNATSDYRIKGNVQPLMPYRIVDILRPVEYELPGGNRDMGFIAHEVQDSFPFLVNGVKDGPDLQSINYNGFIALLVKEIQDLKKRVAILENK
jgi:hypothetical protein